MNKYASIILLFFVICGVVANKAVATELQVKNLQEELKKAILDPKVNIKIASLAGDETMAIYSTILKPQSQPTAHVHSRGIELYQILEGSGEIYTGKLVGEKVVWNTPKKVAAGDVFAINPGVVHQLKNTSTSVDLLLMFVCPHSHLKEDRVITESYSK